MKGYYKFLILLALAAMAFTACEKENVDTIIPEEPVFEPEDVFIHSLVGATTSEGNKNLNLGCIELNFPISFTTKFGEIVEVNTSEEFDLALVPASGNEIIDFNYPIEGIDQNGNQRLFNSAIELGTSFASCIPAYGWASSRVNESAMPAFLLYDHCLELNYPINLENGLGGSFVAEDDIDVIGHLLDNEELYFSFPLNVKSDATNSQAEHLEDMFELFASCESGNYSSIFGATSESPSLPTIDCFTFIYPIEVKDVANDSIIIINSEDELVQLSLTNIDYEIQFPFDIEDENGNIITITEIEDLIPVLIDCDIIVIDTTSSPCDDQAHVLLFYNGLNILTLNNYVYTFNYPITLIVEGAPVILNDDGDYLEAIGGNPFTPLATEIQYPVTVTQFGRDIILTNDQDVCDLYSTLDEPCTNKPGHIQLFFNGGAGSSLECTYVIEYPIEINKNGNTIQIDNRAAYLEELDSPTAYDDIELNYPIDIRNSGQTITFNSEADICDFLDTCN